MKNVNTKANANANTRKDAKAQASTSAKAHTRKDDIAPKVKVALNEEHNGVELCFAEKPSEGIRNGLKSAGFRWHSKKQVWYAKQTPDTLAIAQAFADPSAKGSAKPKKAPKKDAPKVKAEKAETPKVEPKELGYSGAVKTAKGAPTKALIKALNEAEGLTAEMDRTWLWVTGDTKPYKESLKALGFHFSGKREAWYLMA